jgi:glycosyltransferase involved in cell wall biosynthesis
VDTRQVGTASEYREPVAEDRHAPRSADRLAVVHIITGLPVGGAQTMLSEIVRRQNKAGDRLLVISLTEVGAVGEQLRLASIQVLALGMNRSRPNPGDILRLKRIIKKFAPDVVQTWMYHADLIGGLAARLAGNYSIVWNIRHSDLRPGADKRMTIWIARLCGLLSRWLPSAILCNSRHAAKLHEELGYVHGRIEVIPNGIDVEKFCPQPDLGASVRREFGIGDKTKLVGLIARFDKQKDHRRFIAAAGKLADRCAAVHYLLCGENIDGQNQDIRRWINDTSHAERFHLAGIRDDLPRLTAALDLSVSSSAHGEGFSNVIAEAMACAVPCVVTDVGDSALIIGDTGWCVRAEDEEDLSKAMLAAISESTDAHTQRGARARARIVDCFSVDEIFAKYQSVYDRFRRI